MKSRKLLLALIVAAIVPAAFAADPTSLDGFKTNALAYITDGTLVGIAAGVLSLGWVAFKIVRKYASKA
jgi:hypothetical protein